VDSDSFNGLNPILKAFWLLFDWKFLMDCNCTIFHTAANHTILLVRRVTWNLKSGYYTLPKESGFTPF